MKLFKLALILEQDQLIVSQWSFGVKGWKISRSEKIPMPTADPLAEQVLSAIRPLVLKWGLPADVAVVAVTPIGVGGFLSFSFPVVAKKDLDALVDNELVKALPFSLKEVERGYQISRVDGRLEASVFWLPKSWVTELRNALSRAGLRLSELFHRAQMIGAALAKREASGPWGCIEKNGMGVHFHFYRSGSLPDRSRFMTSSDPAVLSGEFGLDMLALSSAGMRPEFVYEIGGGDMLRGMSAQAQGVKFERHENPVALPEMLLGLWRSGGAGVWLVPDRSAMMARLTTALIGVVGAGVVVSIAAWWMVSSLRDQADTLDAEVKRLKPRYQKALVIEQDALRAQREIGQIEALAGQPAVLGVLYEIFRALPPNAWLLRFDYAAEQIEIEGYGSDSHQLGEILQQNKKFSGIVSIDPQLATDEQRQPFALKMKWAGQ